MNRLTKIPGYIIVTVAMISFAACQKEVNDPGASIINNNNNSTTDFKVKKYREDYTSTSGNSSQTFNLTYDTNNRLLSLVDSADATTKQVFVYNSNNSYTMDFFYVGTLIIHEDFFVNSIPLIDSTSQYNDTGDTTLEKNIFDVANHVLQVKDYDYTTAGGPQLYGTSDYTYDADGNALQETDNSAGAVTSYQYYTDLNTIDVGKPYEPKSKNLIKKSTTVDSNSTVTIDYTYSYDSLNRVTIQREQYNTGEVVVRTYTY